MALGFSDFHWLRCICFQYLQAESMTQCVNKLQLRFKGCFVLSVHHACLTLFPIAKPASRISHLPIAKPASCISHLLIAKVINIPLVDDEDVVDTATLRDAKPLGILRVVVSWQHWSTPSGEISARKIRSCREKLGLSTCSSHCANS